MNILFITADQWRAECLSALDHPQVKTPNLDALAAEGLLFKDHYAQAAPCSPSRTSMHTGTYMQNNRCVINGTPVDRRFTNWALEAGTLGYEPSLFGYTDTAADPREHDPGDKALQHYCEHLPGIVDYTPMFDEVPLEYIEYLKQFGYQIPSRPYDIYGIRREGVDWADGGDYPLPLAIAAEHHETRYMVDRCIDWIKARDKPWITHLSLLRPHPPFAAPEPYNQMFDPAEIEGPLRCESAEQESRQHPLLDYYIHHTSKYRSPDSIRKVQSERAGYFGLMYEVDEHLGRLFECIKERGEWDSTLIVFTSDHGEQLGDHWLWSKIGYFDQSYHVPLIVRDPRQQADSTRGKQIDGFTENVDIMPTLLDWLNLEVPAQCDGHSLIPAIESGVLPRGWRQEAHWEFDFRNVRDPSVENHLGITLHQCNLSVIRDRHYKYVHFGGLPPLFFDLQKDPGEFLNQAMNPEYQTLVLEYAQKMLTWKMNHTERGLSETMLGEGGAVTRRAPLQKIAS